MKKFFQLLTLNITLTVLTQASLLDDLPEIKYESFTLNNGLTVVVHEDHKVPMVAVNVWYHVGSKNEKFGKTGFAHLFEHLMFNGTENYNSEYFEPFEKIGSTDQNGTTNSDRTNYFQNVPTNALDLALWMESDRMGHLLGVVDQEKLDEQRGVVQNEKRQGENQPYGRAFSKISESAFPKGHPYSWSTIGSMEDLDAASLEDVQDWFKTYYGPNNAVLALAGDIDLETAKEKVTKFFGDIPAGPPLTKPEKWIAKRSEEKREIMFDNVPQARIYKIWNVPERDTEAAAHFDLASSVLTGGKNSPLYKELVYKNQIATNVTAFYYDREIAGLFIIIVDVVSGEDPLMVENALDDVIGRADFLIVTVPETPDTQGLFNRVKFRMMKKTAYFINIGRGATTNLSDLRDAVVRAEIAGAALDVYEEEPLPVTHQLWSLPNVIMTPHVAAAGPYIDDRRTEVFLDNCIRFAENLPMRNVVDKDKWF